MSDLTDRMVSLDELFDREIAALPERIAAARGWDERLALVEKLVVRRLRTCEVSDPGVVWAFDQIVRHDGKVRIAALAKRLDWSWRKLVERFHRDCGLPPKAIARIVRFNAAHAKAAAVERPDWADIAVACGYSDQPHLIREFVAFAGVAADPMAFPAITFLQDLFARAATMAPLINLGDTAMGQDFVEAPRIYPAFRYRDAGGAIEFLCRAFGFSVRAKYMKGDNVAHAELAFGASIIMLGSVDDARPGFAGWPRPAILRASQPTSPSTTSTSFSRGRKRRGPRFAANRTGLWQPGVHLRRPRGKRLVIRNLLAEGE